MIINADLHIHSRYSGATSNDMSLDKLAKIAPLKGIQILATGDCLHPQWLQNIKACHIVEEGTFELHDARFILSVEIEDKKRVHHLLFFPSLSSAESFREQIGKYSKNIDSDGRPNIRLSGADIAQYAQDVDALIGPSHAFTPWTAIYAYHKTLKECYGDLVKRIAFVELGLSADTDYADCIKELHPLTFLSNSDSHSPHAVRLAREFTQFKVGDCTFKELKKAILRKAGNAPILNVGLPPEEGKYNESACPFCHTHYTLSEAVRRKWKCGCGKRIKIGVKDRISELADYKETHHPSHRPPYIHLIPLAEIIAKAVGIRTPFGKTVTKRWEELVNGFGSEIQVLLDVPYDELAKITTPAIVEAIQFFREQKVIIIPGGGGLYGEIELPGDDAILTVSLGPHDVQKTLLDYA